MDKDQVAEILVEIGILLELKGENPFKTRAYANAARILEGLSEPLDQLIAEDRLGEIKGIGEGLQKKITELVTTGKLAYYDELRASVPAGLRTMLTIPGLGPKKVKALYEKLGVETIEQLEAACKAGQVATLDGFGEKTQGKILDGIQFRRTYASRHLLSDALAVAEPILENLRAHRAVIRCSAAGSVRRFQEVIGDIDLLVSSKKPAAVDCFVLTAPGVLHATGQGRAGEAGDLPRLIEWTELRGSLHNHSNWSDGRNALAEIAAHADELGCDYWAITDHSRASFQANGLTPERLREQLQEIKKINQKSADAGRGCRLLTGAEVDVLGEGKLDFQNDLLAQLEVVVASIHQGFAQNEAETTKRLMRAAENPFVHMLGHLTGRLLLEREPYKVNQQAVIDACAATGTWIELNANPLRFDMDWRLWRHAKDKGVKCVINCDAHRLEHAGFLRLGAGLARKGWLETTDWIHTLPLKALMRALNQKRKQ